MNSSHVDIEALSAYLDGQASAAERLRVQRHLPTCDACAANLEQLEAAAARLSGLAPVEVTADEHRALRQFLLERAPRRAARRQPGRLQWSLAGAFALVAVAMVGLSVVRSSPDRAGSPITEAAAPATDAGAGAIVIDSPDQIRGRVLALPEVIASGGEEQDGAAALESKATAEDGPPQAMNAPAGEAADGAGAGAAARSSAESDPGGDPPAGAQTYGADDFSLAAGSACSEAVAARAGEPLAPLAIREATYRGAPAWLAVYSKPGGLLAAFVVDPAGCAGPSAPQILARSEFPLR